MGLKDFFKKEVKAPFVFFLSSLFSSNQNRGKDANYLKEYEGWVYSCVKVRAEAVGNINLKLIKGEKELASNELLDLLNKVNPQMTKANLFETTQAFLDLTGNAFWFLARDNDGTGKIREIWPLRPDKVSIIADKNNPLMVGGYIYHNQDGSKVPFNKNEILHFKEFNPLGVHPYPHRGMGVVEASYYAIATDNEVKKWNLNFFKNSARADGFLTKETAMTQDELEKLRAQWNNQYGGSANAHKVGILSGGLKWQDITRSQRDMDFIEQRRFSRDEILALFRVPKPVLGITEDVNRANAEASDYIFASRAIKPLMQKIVDTLNEFMAPEFGTDLWFDFTSPVPENEAHLLQEYSLGINKWYSRNEIRALKGLPPTKNGDTIFGTLAEIPIDEAPPKPKQIEKPEIKKKEKPKSKTEKKIDEFISKLPKEEKEPPKQLSEGAIKNYVDLWKKVFEVETQPLVEKIGAFFEKQKNEVLNNLTNELKGLEKKEYHFKAVEDILFDKEDAFEAGVNFITPEINRYVAEAGDRATLLTGIGATFDPETPAIKNFVKERADYFSKTINETTAEKLSETLRVGLSENEDLNQLTDRIGSVYEEAKGYRAYRIARTEISASSNFSAIEAYKQGGVKKIEWLVVMPCEECEVNAGEIVKIGEAFASGDSEPPVHPNCVCTTIPVFE